MKLRVTNASLVHRIHPNPLGKPLFIWTDLNVDDSDDYYTELFTVKDGEVVNVESVPLFEDLGIDMANTEEDKALAAHERLVAHFEASGFTTEEMEEVALEEDEEEESEAGYMDQLMRVLVKAEKPKARRAKTKAA